jgi:hypothetical protein
MSRNLGQPQAAVAARGNHAQYGHRTLDGLRARIARRRIGFTRGTRGLTQRTADSLFHILE